MAAPSLSVAGAFFEVARSGSAVWAGSTLALDFGVAGSATWSYDTEMEAAPAADLYGVCASIVDWGNAAARPWSGTVTLAWQVLDRAPGLGVQVTATGAGSWTPAGGLATFAAWSTVVSGGSISTPSLSTAAGTLEATPGIGNYVPRQDGVGSYSARGSFLTGVGALAAKRPWLRFVLEEAATARMGEVLRTLSSPRRGHVYDTAADTWRQLSLGGLTRNRPGRAPIYRVEWEVLG